MVERICQKAKSLKPMINVSFILYNKHHVLHSLLPDCTDFKYNLKAMRHNLALTV